MYFCTPSAGIPLTCLVIQTGCSPTEASYDLGFLSPTVIPSDIADHQTLYVQGESKVHEFVLLLLLKSDEKPLPLFCLAK